MAKYSELLKHPLWQKKRLEILQRDNFTCVCCGEKEKTLHIHHNKYRGKPWEALDTELYTVCEDCHYKLHDKLETIPTLEMIDAEIAKAKLRLDDDKLTRHHRNVCIQALQIFMSLAVRYYGYESLDKIEVYAE